jgi:hypothetical protein
MAYDVDMRQAARRHLDAAQKLADACQRADVAGYLYGIAAECAVKHMAQSVPAARGDDIFYAHFPTLRTLLLDALSGRQGQVLRRLLIPDDFLNQWAITVRYAPNAQLRDKPLDRWRSQAEQAVNCMDT